MTKQEDTSRSHEHYLRHLLLLGQASPLALNALVKREELNRNETINSLLRRTQEVRTLYGKEFLEYLIDTKPENWSTRVLCDLINVLFGRNLSISDPGKMTNIQAIIQQRNDMDKYAQAAALPFEVFKNKWKLLRDALLELIKDTDEHISYECKRMIISFEREPIDVNLDLLNKIKETSDVDDHLRVAIQEKVVTKVHGTKESAADKVPEELEAIDTTISTIEEEESNTAPFHDAVVFIERLQDTFVYANEPAILTCKLNIKREVVWRKDYTLVEENDTLKFVDDQCCHWLAISNATFTDTGQYTCSYENASTSAFLKVSEKPLKIVKELHIEAEDGACRENMDINLVCVVNLHARKPTWRRNKVEIVYSKRVFVTSFELEHRLTILNASLEDEGEYTVDFGEVKSSIVLTIKGPVDLFHKKQLTEELFRNWVRCALALKYLKIGLEQVSDKFIKDQHADILSKILTKGTLCSQCTVETLLPSHNKTQCRYKKSKCLCFRPQNRKRCPNGFCSLFYDLVVESHCYSELLLANTDITRWCSDPWSVATTFINTTGYKGKRSARAVDCTGLLSLFLNNIYFQKCLGDVEINGETDLFKQARDARNDILHNPTYEVSKGQLDDNIELFKNVLEIKDGNGRSPLLNEPGVQTAIHNLNALQDKQIGMFVSDDLQRQIDSLREHAMDEVAEKFSTAEKQKDDRIQLLEQKLKETENELKLMNDLRSSMEKKKYEKEQRVPFELELHIQVVRTTTDAAVDANQRIYRFVKLDIDRRYNTEELPETSTDYIHTKTNQTVHRLLGFVCNITDTQIGKVINSGLSIDMKVLCFSCKAIDQLLAVINGTKFQEEQFELRKCLELEAEVDEGKTYDILTTCSARSINETRKQLHDKGLIKDPTGLVTCNKHPNMQIAWYCSGHDQLCCRRCRETDHRVCIGLNQGISGKSEHTRLSVVDKKSHNVKILNLKGVTDGYPSSVLKTCKLPKGKFLLADRENSRLKKLDSAYNLISYCDLLDRPLDLCYIGEKTAVVSLGDVGIQFVNVSGKMKLKHLVKLEHYCMGLDFHEDKFYITDRGTLYTYNKNVLKQHVLYKKPKVEAGESLGHVVVSDDGKLIYMSDVDGGLVTIDSNGNHMSTLKNDTLQGASGLCLVNDGTVLVTDENTHSVHHIDYKGESVIGTVITANESQHKPWSVCYVEEQSSLIVGYFYQTQITVFELQQQNLDSVVS